MDRRIDLLTVIGLGFLLMPLLTMWHEIGGHASACAVLGGHIASVGAFYVDCDRVTGAARIAVACAGVFVNIVLALVAFPLWRHAQGDRARLILWLVWVSEAFVASGYFCFSGITGVGDLGPGQGGGIGPLPQPLLWHISETAIGIASYIWLVRLAIRTLTQMLGDSAATGPDRRRLAHGYYAAAGVGAVLTGLLNPIGWFITILSAMASSFGGLAGFISIGFAVPHGTTRTGFAVPRSWPIIIAGVVVLLAFAIVLGPTLHF